MIPQRILTAAIVAAGLAGSAVGQDVAPTNPPGSAPPPARRGGLLPQRTPDSPLAPVSREELMRRFDLNADGRIDEAEAEMARSRMRRERAEIMRNSSVDPLTGRPRGAPPPEPPQKPAGIQAAEVAPPAAKPKDDELLLVPGRPDGTPAPATQTPSAKTQPATGRPSASAARQPVPTRQLPTATTGGVRAGAPAARPGYGALGPRADLNAGRQTTAPTKPAPAARPAIGRAPTPRPIAPPRITAEDIGQ
jgi:hypothetical protein